MLLLLMRILGFIAAAIAIDIRFMDNQYCNGWGVGCADMPPNQCCYVPGECPMNCTQAIGYSFVPYNWEVTLHGSKDTNCDEEVVQSYTTEWSKFEDNRYICLSYLRHTRGSIYRSGKYTFGRHKASDGTFTDGSNTQDCKRVDTLYLANGTNYAIDHMGDDAMENLVGLHPTCGISSNADLINSSSLSGMTPLTTPRSRALV